MNREVSTKDRATMKRGLNVQAQGLEQIADAAEKACAEHRTTAAALLQTADGQLVYAQNCRQQARAFRDLAKEL